MSFKFSRDDSFTDALHMDSVTNNAVCLKHDAPIGVPCWTFQGIVQDLPHYGICNTRAISAGMIGEINPTSLDRTLERPNGRTRVFSERNRKAA